jgi:hypothetical protein
MAMLFVAGFTVLGLLVVFVFGARKTLKEEIAIFHADGGVTYYGYDEPYGEEGDVWFHEPSGHRYVHNGRMWLHECQKRWQD